MYNIQTLAEQQSPFHNLIIRYGKLVKVEFRRSLMKKFLTYASMALNNNLN